MYVNNIVQISGFKSLATIISSNKHSRRKLAVYNNSQKEKDILRGTKKREKKKKKVKELRLLQVYIKVGN